MPNLTERKIFFHFPPLFTSFLYSENEEIVKLLLAKGTNVDLQDQYKQTALHLSVDKSMFLPKIFNEEQLRNDKNCFVFAENENITKMLLEKKPNLGLRNSLAVTPYELALRNCNISIGY